MAKSLLFIAIVYILLSAGKLWANSCQEQLKDNVVVEKYERWPEDGPNPFHYEFYVKDALKQQGVGEYTGYFERFLSNRKSRGLTANALDLMGSGYFLKNPRLVDSITGLRYQKLEISKAELEKYGQPTEVTGDIFSSLTWQKLSQSMRHRNIKDFDLIVMRPAGGWNNYPFKSTDHQAESLRFVLSNAVSILNPQGEMYFALEMHNFNGALNKHPYIVAFKKELEQKTNFTLIFVTTYWQKYDSTPRAQGVIKPK